MTSGSGFIGRQLTGIGTVTVSGAGAQWTSGPGLSVGNFGNGTLNIANGGHVSSTTNSYIAVGVGSIGAATVSGPGSRWDTPAGFLRVGNSGTGTLDISNGGIVASSQGFVGYDGTATGTVTVNGVGSQWTNSAELIVGFIGNGRLNIKNGGAVSNTIGTIGSNGSSTGSVTVDGAGSTWTNSSTLTVGNTGTGTLTISNNGVVSAVSARVGANSGSQGVINIGAAAMAPAAAPGTLTLTGASPSLTLGVTGLLVFNHTSGSYQFAPGVTGAGKVEVYSGTTILTANNTYTGGTTIAAGTLQLGNGGTTGSIVGNVLDNGTLAFNRSDTMTFAGVISGTGVVNQIGTGTTVLTNTNTYTGGTTIAAGTLQLGNGGTTGSIVGNVTDNGTLAFNRSDTMTFAGVISGTGVVNQIGTGTTVLTNTNTYTGGTTIAAGTLQLGNGGTTGSIVGNVLDNGTLAFNRSDTITFAGAISGTGGVNQIGTGTTILTSTSNSYSGATNVTAGVLQAGATNTFSPNSVVTVAAAGTLDLNGFNQTVAGANNAGLINMGTGTAPGTTLTTPNYLGLGGTLAINTYLGTDGSPSDRLVINGGTATGTSGLLIANTGPGDLTVANGILVVAAVNGGTTAPGTFSLAAPAVAGPYEYTLYRGSVDASGPQNWYLRSRLNCTIAPTLCPEPPVPPGPVPPDPVPPGPPIPHYRQEVSLYTAMPVLAATYGRGLIDTLHERMGGDAQLLAPGRDNQPDGAWGRLIGQWGSRDGDAIGIYGEDGPAFDYRYGALQFGLDLHRKDFADGKRDNAGIYVALGGADADVEHSLLGHNIAAGDDKFTAFSLGGYWTRFGANNWYLDGVLQATWYNMEMTANRGLQPGETDGFGLAGSLEGGYPFDLGQGWLLEPQAQLVYQAIDISDFNDGSADVRYSDTDSLAGRIGLRLSRGWAYDEDPAKQMTVWGRADVWHEFLGDPTTSFSSATGFIPFTADLGGTWGKLGLGAAMQVSQATTLYGNVNYEASFDGDDHAWEGKLGLKVKW